jgi:hypothetical protein
VPEGTVTVGAVPAVPAGERSAAGIGAMAPLAEPLGAVVVVDGPVPVPEFELDDVVVVVFELDGFEGEELQAESPTAPARTKAVTSALERRES